MKKLPFIALKLILTVVIVNVAGIINEEVNQDKPLHPIASIAFFGLLILLWSAKNPFISKDSEN